MKRIFCLFIACLSINWSVIAQENKPNPISNTKGFYQEGFSEIVEPLMPAVVNIYTSMKKQSNMTHFRHMQDDPFAKFFEHFDFPFGFEELYQDPRSNALGSGFIIDEGGYIVTNHHLVKDADEINVKLNDNTEFPAKLIGSDYKTDLALLKIQSKKPLPFVKFGDSTGSKIGDWVIAIGNPFGLGGTVTAGIISSKGRDIGTYDSGIVDDYIQTDAAINMGNSGGPMFNMLGQVIGVNTAIFSNSGNNIGIGFAIPSNTVQHVVDKLKQHGKVERGFLGVKIQEVSPQIAEAMNLKTEEGVLVVEVDEKGPAGKAGVKSGDIIIAMDGKKVKNSRKLQIMVADTPLDSKISITVMRKGKKHDLNAKLTKENSNSSFLKNFSNVSETGNSFEARGLIFSDSPAGVIVSQMSRKAEWKMLRVGDIVISANQKAVSNIADFEEVYNHAISEGKKHIVLLVKRHNSKIFLALPI